MYHTPIAFETLKGKTLIEIKVRRDSYAGRFKEQDKIVFVTSEYERYVMSHDQDCCENVDIESIVGDMDDLIGSEILLAEMVQRDGEWDKHKYGSQTWTFYKLATLKGYVDIRWLGESNGYYSEAVDFYLEKE